MRDLIKKVEKAISHLNADDSVALIDSMISYWKHPECVPDLILVKSQELWSCEDRTRSISSLEECINRFPNFGSAYYFIGEHLLEEGDFINSVKYLESYIDLVKNGENDWFFSAAKLLIAYGLVKSGDFKRAKAELEHIPPDDALPFLCGETRINRELIEKIMVYNN